MYRYTMWCVPWRTQEACIITLHKLISNVLANPVRRFRLNR